MPDNNLSPDQFDNDNTDLLNNKIEQNTPQADKSQNANELRADNIAADDIQNAPSSDAPDNAYKAGKINRPYKPPYRRENSDSKESRQMKYRRKMCRFCLDKDYKANYKNSDILSNYITERGKILPRRITGVCAKHQREVGRAIKRARILAALPFSVK